MKMPNEAYPVLAIDTESYTPKLKTHGPMCLQGVDYAIGVSIAALDGFSAYYPVRHKAGNTDEAIIPWLKAWCTNPDHLAIFAHAKFDLEMLWSLGIEVRCKCYDVLAVDALIDENQSHYNLDAISQRYGLGSKDSSGKDAWMLEHGMCMPRNKKKVDWSRNPEVPPEIMAPYAEQDARLTLGCYQAQQSLIAKDKLERVVQLESDLIPVTWAMRKEGVPVDLDQAERLNAQLSAQGEAWLKELREDNPRFEPFAARSCEKFVNSFGIYPPRTFTNEPSITNEWLEDSPEPKLNLVASYRRMEKLRSGCVDGVVLQTAHRGKVHPSWASTRSSGYVPDDDPNGTRTGRIACERPNLAQIPRRHPVLGPMMRALFVPREKEVWHKADYASQEPRIALHYAIKHALPGATDVANYYYVDRKTDYHQLITDTVNAAGSRQINRDQGKTINLALIYWLGKAKLAFKLLMSVEQTESLMGAYHHAVPFVRPLQEKTRDFAAKHGFINTEMGRRRHFDLWEPAVYQVPRKKALPKDEALAAYGTVKRANTYRALNAAVQGSGAEQIKMAMVKLHAEGLTPLVTLYDELDHSIPDDPIISKRICEVMETAIPFLVPHYVEAKTGKDWSCR